MKQSFCENALQISFSFKQGIFTGKAAQEKKWILKQMKQNGNLFLLLQFYGAGWLFFLTGETEFA